MSEKLERYAQLAPLHWSEWDRMMDAGEIDYATKKLLHLCSWPTYASDLRDPREVGRKVTHLRPGRIWREGSWKPGFDGRPAWFPTYLATDCAWNINPELTIPRSIDSETQAANIEFRVADPCAPMRVTRDLRL